jgi:hypothetical protein
MSAVHAAPPKHDPFIDIVPRAVAQRRGCQHRHQADAEAYAYLKISEM